jgi:hypothetical protein
VRFVLDTNVVVAAMRSPAGASAALLMAARQKKITILANVARALEYEATCLRAEHGVAARLRPQQVAIFIDAVIAIIEPVETHFLSRQRGRAADAGGCHPVKKWPQDSSATGTNQFRVRAPCALSWSTEAL